LSAASRRVCYPTPRETSIPIDTDTASDDAVALIMPSAHLLSRAGNDHGCRKRAVQQATRNALYTAELCGADVPFHGRGKTADRVHQSAHWFHAAMAWETTATLFPASPEKQHAAQAMIATIESTWSRTGDFGPLTNVALACSGIPPSPAKSAAA